MINSLPEMAEIWQQTLNWQPSDEQQARFQQLYELILEGNRQLNLTRITEPQEFWEKHLWDSLRGIATQQKFISSLETGASVIDITTYGTTPYKPNVDKITVEHLLSHLSGGWSNSSNDPMFSNPAMNHTQLIGWVLDNRPLDNAPGTKYAYSNFGFCVLGRVIEKITGQTYENYVKSNILQPSGVTDMQISGDTLDQKKTNEVTYYGQGGENPYGMKVARMDAHGGWIAKPIDLVRLSVRVDGVNPKPDILGASAIATMYQASSVNSGYAKGWSVNSANNHWHGGSLPGEQAILVNTSDGFSWSVLVNTRSQKSGFSGDLDQLMWKIRSKVTNWPSFDLF